MIWINAFLIFFILNRINISRRRNEINWACIWSILFGLAIVNLILKMVNILC